MKINAKYVHTNLVAKDWQVLAGFRHIAFSVDNVKAVQKAVLHAGGQAVGKIVTLQISTGAKLTWRYVIDPEGNIIELQSWSN
jgi:predicted enzyme related to lactoylglutathione lyase